MRFFTERITRHLIQAENIQSLIKQYRDLSARAQEFDAGSSRLQIGQRGSIYELEGVPSVLVGLYQTQKEMHEPLIQVICFNPLGSFLAKEVPVDKGPLFIGRLPEAKNDNGEFYYLNFLTPADKNNTQTNCQMFKIENAPLTISRIALAVRYSDGNLEVTNLNRHITRFFNDRDSYAIFQGINSALNPIK